jgi:hypothetical protein
VLFSACSPQDEIVESQTTEEFTVIQEASYVAISLEALYIDSQLIVVAEVTDISSTSWNQDNGEFWDDEGTTGETAFQVHTVHVQINQAILNEISAGNTVELTVIGPSPTDNPLAGDHDLMVGDQVMVFARQNEIAWRGGTKTVVYFVGPPFDSYFTLEEDGLFHGNLLDEPTSLQDLIDQIDAERSG